MRQRSRPQRRASARPALLCAVGVCCALAACRENASGGGGAAAEERTLQKLRDESARARRGEAIGQPPPSSEAPNAELAGRVGTAPQREPLPLPSPASAVQVGPLAFKILHLSAGHSVPAGRLTLTTEETFLGVSLAAEHLTGQPTEMDLSLVSLVDATDAGVTLASDAQRAAGTHPLHRRFAPGERQEVTLYFEVPRSTLRRGVSLRIPAAAVGGADRDGWLPLGVAP